MPFSARTFTRGLAAPVMRICRSVALDVFDDRFDLPVVEQDAVPDLDVGEGARERARYDGG